MDSFLSLGVGVKFYTVSFGGILICRVGRSIVYLKSLVRELQLGIVY